MIDYKNLRVDKEVTSQESQIDNCGCDCSTDSCCSDSDSDQSVIAVDEAKLISIAIDGRSIEVHPEDKNIVDVASRSKIGIPAPCYHAKRKNGCCNACVIEVNGEQKYACSTSPINGMIITVKREDLIALRKQRILNYHEGIKSGNTIPCRSKG